MIPNIIPKSPGRSSFGLQSPIPGLEGPDERERSGAATENRAQGIGNHDGVCVLEDRGNEDGDEPAAGEHEEHLLPPPTSRTGEAPEEDAGPQGEQGLDHHGDVVHDVQGIPELVLVDLEEGRNA